MPVRDCYVSRGQASFRDYLDFLKHIKQDRVAASDSMRKLEGGFEKDNNIWARAKEGDLISRIKIIEACCRTRIGAVNIVFEQDKAAMKYLCVIFSNNEPEWPGEDYLKCPKATAADIAAAKNNILTDSFSCSSYNHAKKLFCAILKISPGVASHKDIDNVFANTVFAQEPACDAGFSCDAVSSGSGGSSSSAGGSSSSAGSSRSSSGGSRSSAGSSRSGMSKKELERLKTFVLINGGKDKLNFQEKIEFLCRKALDDWKSLFIQDGGFDSDDIGDGFFISKSASQSRVMQLSHIKLLALIICSMVSEDLNKVFESAFGCLYNEVLSDSAAGDASGELEKYKVLVGADKLGICPQAQAKVDLECPNQERPRGIAGKLLDNLQRMQDQKKPSSSKELGLSDLESTVFCALSYIGVYFKTGRSERKNKNPKKPPATLRADCYYYGDGFIGAGASRPSSRKQPVARGIDTKLDVSRLGNFIAIHGASDEITKGDDEAKLEFLCRKTKAEWEKVVAEYQDTGDSGPNWVKVCPDEGTRLSDIACLVLIVCSMYDKSFLTVFCRLYEKSKTSYGQSEDYFAKLEKFKQLVGVDHLGITDGEKASEIIDEAGRKLGPNDKAGEHVEALNGQDEGISKLESAVQSLHNPEELDVDKLKQTVLWVLKLTQVYKAGKGKRPAEMIMPDDSIGKGLSRKKPLITDVYPALPASLNDIRESVAPRSPAACLLSSDSAEHKKLLPFKKRKVELSASGNAEPKALGNNIPASAEQQMMGEVGQMEGASHKPKTPEYYGSFGSDDEVIDDYEHGKPVQFPAGAEDSNASFMFWVRAISDFRGYLTSIRRYDYGMDKSKVEQFIYFLRSVKDEISRVIGQELYEPSVRQKKFALALLLQVIDPLSYYVNRHDVPSAFTLLKTGRFTKNEGANDLWNRQGSIILEEMIVGFYSLLAGDTIGVPADWENPWDCSGKNFITNPDDRQFYFNLLARSQNSSEPRAYMSMPTRFNVAKVLLQLSASISIGLPYGVFLIRDLGVVSKLLGAAQQSVRYIDSKKVESYGELKAFIDRYIHKLGETKYPHRSRSGIFVCQKDLASSGVAKADEPRSVVRTSIKAEDQDGKATIQGKDTDLHGVEITSRPW